MVLRHTFTNRFLFIVGIWFQYDGIIGLILTDDMIPLKRVFLASVPIGIISLGTLTSCDRDTVMMKSPNVILIILDDLNYYGFGGPENMKLPYLDKLRESSVVFSKANCQSPICVPSRASFLSGISPHRSGVYLNSPNLWNHSEALQQCETLPELFRRNGYHSFGAGKTFHNKPDEERMARNFDNHPIPEGNFGPFPEEAYRVTSDRELGAHWWGVQAFPDSLFPDIMNTDLVIQFLQQDHDRPFFITLGLWRPHTPFTAPQRFFDMYDPDQIEIPMAYLDSDLDDVPAFTSRFVDMWGRFEVTGANNPDKWKRFIHGYYACSSFADWNLGRLVEALDSSQYTENTIVWVITDNGYHIGAKSHWEKITLWEESAIAPMLIRIPRMELAGHVVTTPVGMIDIYPTMIDLCYLDPPAHQMDGESLRPFLENHHFDWDKPSLTFLGENFLSVRSNRYRYILYPDGTEELYDHKYDPFEWKNLLYYSDYKEIVDQHKIHVPKKFEKSIPGAPFLMRALFE
jgi:arylsulfatase A-like enzyme